MKRRLRNIAKRGRRIAIRGKKAVNKVVKSKLAREIARRELDIAADMLAKAAKKMKDRARKIK